VLIEGIDAEGVLVTNSITGVPGFRPSDVTVSDCRFRTVAGGTSEWARRSIPEKEKNYPESVMFGHLPAYGCYVRHADRIRLRNIECIADTPDARPAVVADDVEDLILSGLECTAPASGAPAIGLHDTRRVFVTGMRAPETSKVLVEVSGAQSRQIRLVGNSLEPEQQALAFADGANAKEGTAV
jgi:hypothetical protein